MKVQNGLSKQFYLALLCVPAIFLPGCAPLDWMKNMFSKGGTNQSKKAESGTTPSTSPQGEALVKINGKPIITVSTFEREFEQLLEENPQLRSILAFMPDAKRNFLTGLINQEIVDMYIKDHAIDQKPEYKADFERTMRSVARMLNTKYFAAAHPSAITDADVQAYYDNNKDKMQELIVSRGGVQTAGIQFESEAAAQQFYDKVKGKSAQFAEVAKEQNLTDKMRDFKLVNKQSVGIDPLLRTKVLEVANIPAVIMVKVNDKTYYVANVTKKEEAQYRPFAEVKEPLKQLVEREKTNEALQKAIGELEKQMHVEISEDYFKRDAAQQAQEMAKAAPQLNNGQPTPNAAPTAAAQPAPAPVAQAA